MRPVARLGDFLYCYGPCIGGNIIITTNVTTFVNNRPIATMFDQTSNCAVGGLGCWAPHPIITGSFTTLVGNRPVARLLDHDTRGPIVTGSLDTYIG